MNAGRVTVVCIGRDGHRTSDRGEDSTMSGIYEEAMKAPVAERLRAAAKLRRARGLDR
jgi:hypothetical protein